LIYVVLANVSAGPRIDVRLVLFKSKKKSNIIAVLLIFNEVTAEPDGYTLTATEVERQYGVLVIGKTDEVREQFYAISVERKISHPAVAAITETAREWLFREPPLPVKQKK